MIARVLAIAVLVLANTALAAPVAVGAKTASAGPCVHYGGVYRIYCQINVSAAEWGQSSYWMTKVLACESNLQWNAYNYYSGTQGIAQYAPQTFWGNVYRLRWSAGTWISPYSTSVAIRLMAYMWWRGWSSQWTCSYIVGYLRY